MTLRLCVLVCTILAALGWTGPVAAQSIVFPADARVINVRAFGAVGDGIADDTMALRAAIGAARQPGASAKLVYVPDGVYRVTDSIATSESRIVIQGQSRANTIIRLADNSPLFQNPGAARPILSTNSGTGFNANLFRSSVYDLTIDAGAGNPGAIGLKLHVNNQGGARNLLIRSSDPALQGAVGLDVSGADKGPGMVRNVEVVGFETGVNMLGTEYGMVFENLSLSGQRTVGLLTIWNLVTIRGFTYTGEAPAMRQDLNTQNNFAWAVLTLIDANISGTGAASSRTAMEIRGNMYLRNVSITGFGTALLDNGSAAAAPGAASFSEYASPRPLALFSAPGGAGGAATGSPLSLNLPVLDTPDVPWDNPANAPGDPAGWWANVESFGAVSNDGGDDTAALQAAIDSGASTVYLPTGRYRVSATVFIRGNVRRIACLESSIEVVNPLFGQNLPVFSVQAGTSPVVVVQNFGDGSAGGASLYYLFEHSATARTLVVRNAIFARGYRGNGPGTVFGEDLTFDGWEIGPGHTSYMRQANPENSGTKITNIGGTAWILGLKTEKQGTAVETFAAGPGGANPGRTEVLGGLIYPVDGTLPLDQPMFRAVDSALSVVIGESSYTGGSNHTVVVEQTIGGVTRRLYDTDTPSRLGFGLGAVLSMFSGPLPATLPVTYAAPAARLNFDESSGSVGADSTGNGRTATLAGAAGFVAGRFGNALSLDGASGSAVIASSAASPLASTEQGAIALWINSSATYADNGMIFYGTDTADPNANGGGSQNELHLNFAPGGSVSFFIEGGAGPDLNLSSNRALNDGQWHHIVVSWDRAAPTPDGAGEGFTEMFVDGRRTAWTRQTFSGFPLSVARLGRPNAATRWYAGLIDDLRVFDRPVQHAEAMDLYFTGLEYTNYAPTVRAGSDSVVQNATRSITLAGEVNDDGQPNPPGNVALGVAWSVVSGPGSVVFGNAASPTSTATFSTFGNYRLRLTVNDGVATAADEVDVLVVEPLPAPWLNTDVGGALPAGYSSTPDGARSFSVLGSGSGHTTFFDTMQFAHQILTAFSNVEVQTRLTALPCGPSSGAGVMYRQSTSPFSAHVGLLVNGAGQLVLIDRSGTGGGIGGTVVLPSVTLPIYLRMERINGNAARGWYSFNGINWVQAGDRTANTGFLGATLGIYAYSGSSSLCAASFTSTRLGARCVADFDSSGAPTVDDIFIYINAWFATNPACDVDGVAGVTIDDIFVFINTWFRGC